MTITYSLASSISSNLTGPAGTVVYTLPETFDWTTPFTIYRDGNGVYTNDHDFDSNKPTGTVKHVSPTGSDSNSGDSEGDAYATFTKAAVTEAADVVYVHPTATGTVTYYGRSSGIKNFSGSKDVAVEFMGNLGDVISDLCIEADTLSWTQQSSPNDNVWKATRSAVTFVHDTSVDHPTEFWNGGTNPKSTAYDNEASVAACQANAGSWFLSGSDLYIHALDGLSPNVDNIRIRLNENAVQFSSDYTAHFKNVVCVGRVPFRFLYPNAANTGVVTLNQCAGYWGDNNQPNMAFDNVPFVYLKDPCSDDARGGDALNYKSTGGSAPTCRVLEDTASTIRAGTSGDNNNGSSVHADCVIVRMNSTYAETLGPVVNDVGGSHSIDLNCTASDCLTAAGDNEDAGFRVADSTSIKWQQDCTTTGTMEYDRSAAGSATFNDLGGFTGVAGQDFGTIS